MSKSRSGRTFASPMRNWCLTLPFLVEDAARPEVEIDASQDTERPFPRLGQELRLDKIPSFGSNPESANYFENTYSRKTLSKSTPPH
mmetsp:Transcript_31468/g.36301  ORF Transcript_31468/g.36301 Transcript_31468/m.36301 type:complete len:87 (+) Transcript_31468:222-482(+)